MKMYSYNNVIWITFQVITTLVLSKISAFLSLAVIGVGAAGLVLTYECVVTVEVHYEDGLPIEEYKCRNHEDAVGWISNKILFATLCSYYEGMRYFSFYTDAPDNGRHLKHSMRPILWIMESLQ